MIFSDHLGRNIVARDELLEHNNRNPWRLLSDIKLHYIQFRIVKHCRSTSVT